MNRSIASAAAAVVLAATLVACGGSDGDSGKVAVTKSAGSSGADTSGGQQTPDTAPSSTTPSGAKVGDTLSLEGLPGMGATGNNVQADVTLTKYEDNAKPSLDAFAAPDGQRLVAAEFTILSTGDATYDDPGNLGAKVVDSTGKVYAGKPGDPTVGESLDLTIILQPGDKTTGWVIFNVPQDVKITAVTYQMDSLLQTNGEHTGRWNLRA
ncbi:MULTISPECIES: DUF4352 domain-containing protein [Streptomyces]|uniref:DUF4352 domain-containing protein n=1 Tax=Streptomyces lycopersici TaxID=2974589 RepID=UPI0021CE5443|nr:DUF4352 domain-containing protein [Streptomyces sp. NEAU-383]